MRYVNPPTRVAYGFWAIVLTLLLWCLFALLVYLLGHQLRQGVVVEHLAFCLLVAVNATTFAFFGYDKRISGRGIYRVPERLLLLLALIGGSLGGYLAQLVFRHKTRKASFQVTYFLVVLTHIALIVYWAMVGIPRAISDTLPEIRVPPTLDALLAYFPI